MSVSAIQPSAQYPITASTLADCLRLHAERQPQKIAYRFLKDGEVEERTITYHELDLAARSVAALLEKHSAIGDRVLLLFPPGLDFIIALCACFYSGRVAVPAYPPRPNRGTDRLIGIIQDASPAVALSSQEVQAKALHRFVNDKAFQGLAVISTDSTPPDAAREWEPVRLDPAMLALLQYTSGSTSIPKGVQVTHANLMHNEALIQKAFGQTEQDLVVGWLPVYHDMGLIGNVLQPLYCGSESILMPPTAFLQNPVRWLAAISRYGATTSGGPNFAYEFCCHRITAEQKANLNLSSWRVAYNGAEPVRAQSLEQFAAAFRNCGFRASAFVPCYGLAESTLFVSGGASSAGPTIQAVEPEPLESNKVIRASSNEPGHSLVGCGRAGAGHNVAIVDPERLTLCPQGTVGEIWVSGPSVANGYWNRGQETSDIFEARLADTGEGPFLRTGDLGFLLDGELFITGRRKDLIIIRGRNHYPHDLEATAERAHPALRACIGAAFSIEAEGEERLVLVHEINPRVQAETGTVIAAVRQAIAEEHELQLYAVALARPGEIPRTTSGKIQRLLCRKTFLAGGLAIISEWRATFTPSTSQGTNNSESEVQDWQTWLILQLAQRLRVAPESIEADQPPSRYGLDSLAAAELAHEIEKAAGIVLPFADLISGLSITELAAALCWQKELAATGATITIAPRRHDAVKFPLSHGQRALFFLYQLDRQNSAYHIHQALKITSALDEQALARAFRLLVRRHPALRTVFKLKNGSPVQELLAPDDGPVLEERACRQTQDQLLRDMAAEARTPFDLEAAPPVRCILFRKSASENYLLFTIHHIISDFWSLSLFIQELAALYESEAGNSLATLLRPELEYGDYVHWQADLLAGVEGERHWAYWREELAGELPLLDLPADHPRPTVQTYRGAAHQFRLNAGVRRRLRGLAAGNGATLYSVLLSAWAALLHRCSGQLEVLVGSPAAGRTHAAFRSVAGYFVNPVVLRISFAGDPRFENLLAQVRGKVLGALAHQDFPFPLLVEKLQPKRDPGRSPLFQALFVMQGDVAGSSLGLFALGESGGVFETKALTLESVSLSEEASQFDIALQACEARDELILRFQYNADLFEPQTIARMAGHLRTLLETLDSSLRVSQLPLLSPQERGGLETWNLTTTVYPEVASLHEMIEAQVERTPHLPAVWHEGEFLSYAELNRKANQLAHQLQSLGVQPESLVGICMERSFALVIGLLGILKAGAAYVPFDPSYPAERLSFLVQDAGVPVLLVQDLLRHRFDLHQCLIVSLDSQCSAVQNENTANPKTSVAPENLAYVIYTSGSTGNPKGAMNSHRAICNRLQWMQAAYQLGADDRVLQKTPFSFDVSVWEFFWPLMTGASLVLARPDGHRDSAYLRDLINERHVTTLHFVPSMLSVFLDEPAIESCISLRRVIASGEALSAALVRRFFSRLNAELHNLYGPTEAAVDVTSFACTPNDDRPSIPIGTPIANIQTHILDSHLGLSPIGVVGELYIGGVGLGRGYHGRPDLTAERFLPNPFSGTPGARMYRTGDLVRYLPDRNIEFLGRNDDQVKIRGFRIELGEIEAALARHPAVSQAVVIARQTAAAAQRPANYQVSNEPRPEPASEYRGFLKPEAARESGQRSSAAMSLAAYLVCSTPAPATHELRAFLRESLPEYMVPADFVFLTELPLSPNGKLDKRALPEPDVSLRISATDYIAPATSTEIVLAKIWSEVLGVPEIGANDNFFELGGDSIRSLQVRSRALQRGLTFTVQDMMRFQTIRELAQRAETAAQTEQQRSLEPFALLTEADRKRMPADAEDAYPLSKVQAGLVYHLQYDPGSAIYHDIFFYQVRAPLNFELFRQAVQENVDRHPILRTSFHLSEFSEPLQIVHRHVTARVEHFDWRHLSAPEQQKAIQEWTETEKRRTLHLQDTSLIFLFVHQLENDVFQIVSSYYNILLDGWSEASLITGLVNRYTALLQDPLSAPLPGLSVKYRDFVALEREALRSEDTRAYWENALRDCVVRPLSASSNQAEVDANQIRSLDVELSAGLLRRLDAMAAVAGAAPKHVLLAAHIKVLSLLLDQTDLIVGFQTNGRLEELDADQVLGMHNTILPLRVKMSPGSWLDLVRQAFAAERDLLPYRRYPLVELQKIRGRQQLFDTVFNYTHFHVFQGLSSLSGIEVQGAWGLERSHYTLRAEFNRNPFTRQVQFDLNFNGSLISLEQVRQIAECYTRVFRAMAEHPNASHFAETFSSRSDSEIFSSQPGTSATTGPLVGIPLQEQTADVVPEKSEPAHLNHPALTPMEELVGSMWSQVLGKEQLSPDDNFFVCGGDSLLATQLMLYVRARLKIDMPLRILFEEASTLRIFAGKVEETLRSGAHLSRPPLERAARVQTPPLSFAQRRLWFVEHLEPTVYNVPAAIRITGSLDRAVLLRSLNEIIRRHESLRTTFHLVDREPIQRIAESLQIKIPVVDLASFSSQEKEGELKQFIQAEVRRPFNLENGPLMRVYLVRMTEEEHVLLAILHHIISDGWSVGLFITEMIPLYEAFVAGQPSPLPEITLQYADFAAWQHGWLQGQLLEQQISYWRNKLKGPLPVLDLPGDFPRPESPRGNGSLVGISLPPQLVQQLRLLGNREGCTMFMTLLSAFYVLLHAQLRREDLIVGTDLANRSSIETEKMIGFFVNQAALRMDLSGDPAFTELLARVRTLAMEAYLHQDVPFDRVVEAVNPPRERNRTPLFQVKFVLQNAPRPKLEMERLHLTELELDSGTAKFDLLINVFQQEKALRMLWEFSSEIFRESTIRRMAECYVAVLESVVSNPELRLHESVAVVQQVDQSIREKDDEKRRHALREKLIQKSRKAIV